MTPSRPGRRIGLAFLIVPLLAATVLASTTPKSAPAWKQVWEHWYELDLAGSTAGWMRETVSNADGKFRTESEMTLRIGRGGAELEISMSSAFVETEAGKPISLHYVQQMAQQKIDSRWDFADDHVRAVTTQGGREIVRQLERPDGEWLTPHAAHRFRIERMEGGADEVTYRTISGENGLDPITMTHTRIGEEQFEQAGRMIPVTIWESTTSAMPGVPSVSKLSSDGHLLHDETMLPVGRVVTRLSTKADAMVAARAPAPEMMVRTFVPVDPPIQRARATTASALRLRTMKGEMPELPSAGAQRFEPDADGRTAMLRIDIKDNLAVPELERDAAEYDAATTMVDAEDAFIRKLARSACRKASADPLARADALRGFVHRHISGKSLQTAFATASETARTRTGDCSEHAVLLCAMMRAEGIPARVATGLIYADAFVGERDIFGWHMWTQAQVDGRWVDFDATLDQRYDAAHVLTGTSSLADGLGGADLSSMMQLLGNLEIEVVDVTYAP